jgi:hypothetical protein
MPFSLRHKKWEIAGRTFEVLDELGEPIPNRFTFIKTVNQRNVDLGGDEFVPYLWDDLGQSIRYGDLVCEFYPDGYQTIREFGSTETLIDDQRFELQYFREQGNQWRVLDLYNVSLSVDQQDDHCTITRRLDDEDIGNWLEVDYLFRPNHKVKLTFRLHVTDADQYRIRLQNSGISGELTEVDYVDITTRENLGIYKLLFDNIKFLWDRDEIAIHEGYTVEDQAGGKKLDFFLGDFDLPSDGDVVISPIIFGPQENSDDCLSADGTYFDNDTGYIAAGNNSGQIVNAGHTWTNVSVPRGSTIDDAYIQMAVGAGSGVAEFNIHAVDENPVPPWSQTELPEDKDTYAGVVVPDTIGGTGLHETPELKDLIAQITDDAGWTSEDDLAVICLDDNSPSNNFAAWIAEESGTGAELTIEYTLVEVTTVPPTTLPPTTLPPTTLPPTTLAPTTLPPTTLPPTTLAPTTLPPTTLAPTTLAPTTLPPVGTVCWGHDSGVVEINIRDFTGNWAGSGSIVFAGDAEKVLLYSGQEMISETWDIGFGRVKITIDKYAAGFGAPVVQYKSGNSKANCEADIWRDYIGSFVQDGWVKVKVNVV